MKNKTKTPLSEKIENTLGAGIYTIFLISLALSPFHPSILVGWIATGTISLLLLVVIGLYLLRDFGSKHKPTGWHFSIIEKECIKASATAFISMFIFCLPLSYHDLDKTIKISWIILCFSFYTLLLVPVLNIWGEFVKQLKSLHGNTEQEKITTASWFTAYMIGMTALALTHVVVSMAIKMILLANP